MPLFTIIHNTLQEFSADGQLNNMVKQTGYSSTVERDPEENMSKA